MSILGDLSPCIKWIPALLLMSTWGLSAPPPGHPSSPSWEACLQVLKISSDNNPGCEAEPNPLIEPIPQATQLIRPPTEDTRAATHWLKQIRDSSDPNTTLTILLQKFRTDSTLTDASISEFYRLSEGDPSLRTQIQTTTEALRVAEAFGAPFQIGSASYNLKVRLDYYLTRLEQMMDARVPGMVFGQTQVLDEDSLKKANLLREKIRAEIPSHESRTQDPEEFLKRSERGKKIALEFIDFEENVFEPAHFQLIHETIPADTEAQLEVLSWIKGVSISGLGLVAQLKGGPWAGAGVHGVFCALDRSYTEWILSGASGQSSGDPTFSEHVTACVIEAGVGAGAGKLSAKTFQIIEGSAARKLAKVGFQAGAGVTIGSSAAVVSNSAQSFLRPNSFSDSAESACDVFLRSLENEAERYTTVSGLTSLAAETLLHRKIFLANSRTTAANVKVAARKDEESKPLLTEESKPLLPQVALTLPFDGKPAPSLPTVTREIPVPESVRSVELPRPEFTSGSNPSLPKTKIPAAQNPSPPSKGPSKNQLAREQKERERKEREAELAERKRQSFDSRRAETETKKQDHELAAENRRQEQEASRIAELKKKSEAEEKLRTAEQSYRRDRSAESLDAYLSLQAEKLQLPFGGSSRTSMNWDERNAHQRPYFRFVPKVGKSGEILRQRTDSAEGFVDQWGLIWIKGPARTSGDSFEWDVQIPKGKFESLPSEIKARAKDSGHLNVSIDGVITH